MPLTLSYDYHGILCPELKLSPDQFFEFKKKQSAPDTGATFEISVDKLRRTIKLFPRNKYIGEITPENFRAFLEKLVADKIITEKKKQKYDTKYTAQYQTLASIGKDHSNYLSSIGNAYSKKYEQYDFSQPKTAEEIIFLEKQRKEFKNNKAIKKSIPPWSVHLQKLDLQEHIYLAAGFLAADDLLHEAKTKALKISEKLSQQKFTPGESSLLDWIYTGFNSDGIILTKEQLAPINIFLDNNPELLPLFQAIALWSVVGTDSRLDDPKINTLRNQLQLILFAATNDEKEQEKFPDLHGQYDLLHTVYIKYDENHMQLIASIIHEMMHAVINLIDDNHALIPESMEKTQTSWKKATNDSLHRINSITPRPETKEILEILKFSQYAFHYWQGELISRTTEVKYSYPDLEILLNKASRTFLREEIEKLCQRATIWVQNAYNEAGLRLIKAFEKEFFTSTIPIKLDTFESALLNEAFQSKQTILDCFIRKKLKTVSAETLITYLHTAQNISENAILLSSAKNGHLEVVETLFSQFKFDFKQQTVIKAFNLAVKNNHIDIVKLFIKQNIDVNSDYEQKLSPLHYAAAFGHTGLAQLLVQQGANVNALDRDGNSVLHWAAQAGHLELVKYFTQHSAKLLKEKNQKGETALHLAAHNGHFEVVKYLLSQDKSLATDVTLTEDTALHLACSKGHVDIVQLLLAKEIDVNAVNNFGETALYLAVKHRQPKSVEIILKVPDIDIAIACKNTLTPLHLAVASEQVAIATQLAETSADEIDLQTCSGDTALHMAAKLGNTTLCFKLIKAGASLNLENNKKATPLHLAIMSNAVHPLIKLLLDSGAYINAQTSMGSTALHLALANKRNSLIECLVSNNQIDINAQDTEGNTPLHSAILYLNIEGAKILIKSCKDKIDINITNKNGQSPLSLAEKSEETKDIANLLKSVKTPTILNTKSSFFKAPEETAKNTDEFKQENTAAKQGFLQGA